MKRRDFLKTGGIAGTAGLILDGCGKPQQLIPLLVAEDRFVPGEEGWVRTVCQQCSAGCGITVRVMQGESIRTIDGQQKRVKAVQAKKIEGNPEHPISMGGTCARGQAGVQALYHPDRIQTPLKLSGPRGSGQYQPITLEGGAAAARHAAAAAAGGAAGDRDPHRPQKPRHDGHRRRTVCGGRRHAQPRLLRPVRSGADSQGDGAGDRHVAAAGGRFRQRELSCCRSTRTCSRRSCRPCTTSTRTARCVRDVPGIRGKFVHAEPRLSQTAACADEWLPIKPGTEGLLALAMAHVIVNEKLYDAEFVAQSTGGFAEWSASLGDYAPEKIAPQIDVPAAIDSARRARVRHTSAERRHRRQPRCRVADRDLRAERARGRIRPSRGHSVRSRRSKRSRAGCRRPASGVRRQAWSPKPEARNRYSQPDRRNGRKPGESAARARHESALHAARSGQTALGARQRAVHRELLVLPRRNVRDGRSDSAEPYHASSAGSTMCRSRAWALRFARSASQWSSRDGIRATPATS